MSYKSTILYTIIWEDTFTFQYSKISEFSDNNLFCTRNGCCTDFSSMQAICKIYVVSELLLSVSVFCFALSPVPSYFFR